VTELDCRWADGADPADAEFLRRVDRTLVPGPPEDRWVRVDLNVLDADGEVLGGLTTAAANLPAGAEPTGYAVRGVEDGRIINVEAGEAVTEAFRRGREARW